MQNFANSIPKIKASIVKGLALLSKKTALNKPTDRKITRKEKSYNSKHKSTLKTKFLRQLVAIKKL